MHTVSIRVKGKVQGVFFRKFVSEQARQLHICGTVENTADGDVLIYASGEPAAMEAFLKACRSGPIHARVDELIVTPGSTQIAYTDFRILR